MKKKRGTPFKHYEDMSDWPEILEMRKKHGVAGYGLYLALAVQLGKTEDFTLETDYGVIAQNLNVSKQTIKSIVEDFGLFRLIDNGKRFEGTRIDWIIDDEET